MKHIAPLFFAVLVTFLLAACGSSAQATATDSPSDAASAPVTAEPSVQSGPTASVPLAGGTQVNIALADNTIDASTTTFRVGVPYIFVITNAGQHAHNFNINPPVSVTGSLQGSLDSALLVVPQAQLAPGQTATVEFTFPESAAGQLLELSCLIRRHYDDGMKVDIVVTP